MVGGLADARLAFNDQDRRLQTRRDQEISYRSILDRTIPHTPGHDPNRRSSKPPRDANRVNARCARMPESTGAAPSK
jgi:hypothetical protein